MTDAPRSPQSEAAQGPPSGLTNGWEEIAAQASRDRDYYRSLVVEIGEMFGEAAYIADDGGRAQDVLCAKVPELVRAVVSPSGLTPPRAHQVVCTHCGYVAAVMEGGATAPDPREAQLRAAADAMAAAGDAIADAFESVTTDDPDAPEWEETQEWRAALAAYRAIPAPTSPVEGAPEPHEH